jgi:hypothetical protein
MDSFFVKTDPEQGLVTLVVIGELLKADGEKIITVARTKAAEHGYAVLYDMRQSRTNIPAAELFQVPRNLEVFRDEKMRRVKAAILISPEDAVGKYKFYETVSDNLGIRLKIFFDEAQALEWLDRKPSPVISDEIIIDE